VGNQEILSRTQEIFREVLDQPDLELIPSMTAQDVEGWDSLNHVRLIVGIEREFGIRMKGSEVVKAACVGDLLTIISEKYKK